MSTISCKCLTPKLLTPTLRTSPSFLASRIAFQLSARFCGPPMGECMRYKSIHPSPDFWYERAIAAFAAEYPPLFCNLVVKNTSERGTPVAAQKSRIARPQSRSL